MNLLEIWYIGTCAIVGWELGGWIYSKIKFKYCERKGKAFKVKTKNGTITYFGEDAELVKKKWRREGVFENES